MRNWLFVCFIGLSCAAHAEDVDALTKKLADADVSTRIEAATALGKMGEAASPAVPALILAFKQAYKGMPTFQTSELRKTITIAFGQIGPKAKDAVPLLEYDIRHTASPFAVAALSKVAPDRIGEVNEMVAVHWCKQYCASQAQIFLEKKKATGVGQYAQQLQGENGMESRTSLSFANADGDSQDAKPLCNYCFRVLKAQGGKKSYIVDGKMTLGAALVAYPVEYGAKGKKTYIIAGIDTPTKLYSKDLGADSPKIGKEMTEFNPDETWKEEDAGWGLGPGSAPELKP